MHRACEAIIPIEDASLARPDSETPIVAVADEADAARYDPWVDLPPHRPLGELMRVRKVAYRGSQKARSAA